MGTMAEHQDEVVTAFQDDFTQRHSATFMILVEPIFADQVSEAASLLARSKADAERQDFLQQFVTAAQAIESALAELNVDGAEPSEEKLEEVREAQRTLVSDLLAAAEGSRLEATDRELEGFSNLILSFVLNLFSVSNPAFSDWSRLSSPAPTDPPCRLSRHGTLPLPPSSTHCRPRCRFHRQGIDCEESQRACASACGHPHLTERLWNVQLARLARRSRHRSGRQHPCAARRLRLRSARRLALVCLLGRGTTG